MVTIRRMRYCQLILSVVVLLILVISSKIKWTPFKDPTIKLTPLTDKKTGHQVQLPINTKGDKHFFYLYNVAECLDPYHLQNGTLLNGRDGDILVLSYKNPCKRLDPSHVEYLHVKNKTSWTEGRNILCETAMKRKHMYLYYIFSDGDIRLENNSVKSPTGTTLLYQSILNNKNSTFEKLEYFLLDYRPAISSIENLWRVYRGIKELGIPLKPYISFMTFDGQFNAYHGSVIDTLLPYTEKHDKISWWWSQAIQQCKAFFQYHLHEIMFTPLTAINAAHSKYPKKTFQNYQIMCSDELQATPDHVKNNTLVKKIMQLSPGRSPGSVYKLFPDMAPPRALIKEYRRKYTFSHCFFIDFVHWDKVLEKLTYTTY